MKKVLCLMLSVMLALLAVPAVAGAEAATQ